MPTIKILEPDLNGNEARYLQSCISEGWISSQGRFVGKFEQLMLRGIKSRQSVSCSNGTAALHLALMALGIGKGDEVVVPDVTFGASVNAICHAGATPVFADIDPRTWNISLESVRNACSKRTKAIMPVALFGSPSGIKELIEWARLNNFLTILDAAEAVGAKLDGKDIGEFGDAVTYSFFGNKTITTGEGGGIIFNSQNSAALARILRDHGMTPGRRYHHDVVGYNYRLTNIQAALGVAQYERLDEILEMRTRVVDRYKLNLVRDDIQLQKIENSALSSHWVFAVKVSKPKLPEVVKKLEKNEIEYRRCFEPMSRQPAFQSGRAPVKLNCAGDLYDTLLLLPCHTKLATADIDSVCDAVLSGLD